MKEKTKIYYLHKGDNIPFYVGKTIRPNIRLSQHKFDLKNQNIKMFLLEDIEEKNYKFWETYWIDQFEQWGFQLENKNKGGGGPSSGTLKPKGFNVGRKHSETTKQKIGKSNIGNKGPLGWVRSDSTKKKIGMANSKPKPLGFGEKIKNQKTGTPNPKRRKPILQYNLKGEFIKEWDGAITIRKKLGINNVSIMQCCKGIIKTSNNFIWRYKK